MTRDLFCVIDGRHDRWEAMCLDLDIAVAGDTFDGTLQGLEAAIVTYLAAAGRESQDDRRQLLRRRSPFGVQAILLGRIGLAMLLNRIAPRREVRGSFRLPCPA